MHSWPCMRNVKVQRHHRRPGFPKWLSVGALTKGSLTWMTGPLTDTLCERKRENSSPPQGRKKRRITLWNLLFAFRSCTEHARTTLSCYCRLLYLAEWVSRIFVWHSRSAELELNWMMCGFRFWPEAVNSLLCFESYEWIEKTLVGLLNY